MQNNETGKRWSDLHGKAIVTIDSGKKVGTLEDFYFEPRTNTVYALYVKTGVFGHRALRASSLNAIGTDAITFADESNLIEEKDDGLLTTLPLGRALLTYKVLSEGGTVVGTVGNVIFDTGTPANLRVIAYELSGGLRNKLSGHYPTFSSTQVVRYGEDVLVIPDSVALPLIAQ
ncbi:MAG: hypothetical protein NVS4B11_07120 [Ktedonobacteraceae bacterium]